VLFNLKQPIHEIIAGYMTYGWYQDIAAMSDCGESHLDVIQETVAKEDELRDAASCIYQLQMDFNLTDTSRDALDAMMAGLSISCYFPANLRLLFILRYEQQTGFLHEKSTCPSYYINHFFRIGNTMEFDLWLDEIRSFKVGFNEIWNRVINFVVNYPVEISRIGCYWMLFDHVDEMGKWDRRLENLASDVARLWVTNHHECSNVLLTTVIPSSVLLPYGNTKAFVTPFQLPGGKRHRIVVTDAHVLMTSPGGLKPNRMISPWEYFASERFIPICGMNAFEFTGDSLRILNGLFLKRGNMGFDEMCAADTRGKYPRPIPAVAMSDK
jgi:hypothetical protein